MPGTSESTGDGAPRSEAPPSRNDGCRPEPQGARAHALKGAEQAGDLSLAEREALTRREPDALERFYELYFERIYGYVRRLLRDEHLAEDTTQDIFMHLHRTFATYDPTRALRPWVFAIATNRVRDVWQSRAYKKARCERNLEWEEVSVQRSHSPTPLESLEASQQRQALADAIDQVPDTLRSTLLLRAYEGLSFETIAQLFDRTEAAIRKRYSRALSDLRDNLNDEPLDVEERA